MNTPIVIYYHVFLIGNWFQIVNEQIDILKKSNLFHNAKIKVGLSHDEQADEEQNKLALDFFKQYDNVEVLFLKKNGCSESETLGYLKDDCDSSDTNTNILYIHAKGVTQWQTFKEQYVAEWRNMMEFFLIERWEKCVDKLDEGYDCCGINYQVHAGNIKNEIRHVMIYNGNFFWVKSDYVKKLDRTILFEHRYSAENWLCSIDHKGYSFYDSPIRINLYCESNTEYKDNLE